MIDPAILRDNLDAVRTALANRGVDLTTELEELAALESHRRRLLPELEGLKREQNAAGDEVARAKRQGLDTTTIQEASRARAQQIKQLSVELESIEQRRNRGLLRDLRTCRTRACRWGRARTTTSRSGDVGDAADVRLHAAGALGSRAGARHHRLRARHEDRRRALLGPRSAPARSSRAR